MGKLILIKSHNIHLEEMSYSKDKTRVFTREQVDALLSAAIGQTLEAVDKAGLFKLHAGRDKVKGIAGDIIEVSVLGCNKDSLQEPDIIVDGELTEVKTTGMVKPKKNDSPYIFECKEPVSVTAVSIDKIVHEEFESSNFWHKLAHLLWVYYWYNSAETVKLIQSDATYTLHRSQGTQLLCTNQNCYSECGLSFVSLNHKRANALKSKNHHIAKGCTHARYLGRSSTLQASAPLKSISFLSYVNFNRLTLL